MICKTQEGSELLTGTVTVAVASAVYFGMQEDEEMINCKEGSG